MNGISLEPGLQTAEPDVSSQSAPKKCLAYVNSLLKDIYTIRKVGSTEKTMKMHKILMASRKLDANLIEEEVVH